MCGKFTAMASWTEVVAFSKLLTRDDVTASDNDREITFRVMSNLPVIIWDKEASKRRVLPMRWGFPDPKNWKIPKPTHARSETIDTTKAFASAFLDGQRGIVIVLPCWRKRIGRHGWERQARQTTRRSASRPSKA
jgi:putative SOS response-associated peptidase YedK